MYTNKGSNPAASCNLGIVSHNANMIDRIYTHQVRDKLGKFPAVAVLGPRQCGKTTLARWFDGAYFDMESEGSEARLDAEWDLLTADDRLPGRGVSHSPAAALFRQCPKAADQNPAALLAR